MIKITVDDSSCAGNIKWLPNPRLVKVRIRKIKLQNSSEFLHTDGTLAVRFPSESGKISYGEEFTLDGTFFIPETPIFGPSSFDFKNFLRTRRIYRIFNVSEILEKREAGLSLFRELLNIRNFVMEKTAQYIDPDENKGLLAALLFGCRQGLDSETRRNFILSGTVHIFTVSGLHVGVLALMLFWILRWIPFTPRYILIPFLIFFYVLTTGANPPAVRALLMISIWAFSRAFLYSTSILNVIFLSASLLLLYNPLYINDRGFQYSFTVVFFLILAWRQISMWQGFFLEKTKWVPQTYTNSRTFLFNRLFIYFSGTFLFASVAWLASSGITAFYQGLFLPFSVLANIIMIPFVWLLFIFSGFKFLFSFAGFISEFLGKIQACFLEIMKFICVSVAGLSSGLSIPVPGVCSVAAFYLFLLILISGRKKKWFLISTAGIFMISGYWCMQGFLMKPEIAVFHGGTSQEFSVIINDPLKKRTCVFNMPSYESFLFAKSYLTSRGSEIVNCAVILQNKKDFCAGMPSLFSGFNVKKLFMGDRFRKKSYAEKAVTSALKNNIEFKKYPEGTDLGWTFNSWPLSVISKRNFSNIEYKIPGNNIGIRTIDENTGVRLLEIRKSGKTYRSFLLENSLYPEYKIIRIE